ncbi:hypothetical protein AHAS_Ahas19G0127200 [Arachis hypogaea]
MMETGRMQNGAEQGRTQSKISIVARRLYPASVMSSLSSMVTPSIDNSLVALEAADMVSRGDSGDGFFLLFTGSRLSLPLTSLSGLAMAEKT